VLDAFAKLNKLLGEVNYTPARKNQMVDLMKGLVDLPESCGQGLYIGA
jgi:hypothetical protein